MNPFSGLARKKINNSQTLLVIPHTLWIRLDVSPEVRDAELASLPDCSAVEESVPGRLAMLKLAVILALEILKGHSSFYFPWLRHLPTFDDLQKMHPLLAESTLLADFQPLTIQEPFLGLCKAMYGP